jgi:hypothetical protein
MVVSEDEWIPALNEVGVQLCTAHKYFVGAELSIASSHGLTAAAALRELPERTLAAASSSRPHDAAELNDAAAHLEDLVARLKTDAGVDRQELVRTFVSAQRANLAWEWSHYSPEKMVSVLELPHTHFRRARSMLQAQAFASSATRIRQGTAYLHLAAHSAGDEDRALLNARIAELNQLAHEADVGKLTQAKLRAGLVHADSAYAAWNLRCAAARYREKHRIDAARALREAAARMRRRLDWLGREGEDNALIRELDMAGEALAKGARPPTRRVEDLVERAARTLQTAELLDTSSKG